MFALVFRIALAVINVGRGGEGVDWMQFLMRSDWRGPPVFTDAAANFNGPRSLMIRVVN